MHFPVLSTSHILEKRINNKDICTRTMLPNRLFTLVLMLIIASACQPAELPATPTHPYNPPTARIISAVPAEATTSQAVAFHGSGYTWNSTVILYKWRSALDGDLSNKASFTTKTLSEGKHKIFFSIQDDTGEWSQEITTTVTISPPIPPPIINYFKASSTRIGLEDSAVISWHTSGAAMVSIDQGIGSVGAEGKRTISPKISTQYTLISSNAGGNTTATINIIVVPVANTGLPAIKSFAADPGSIASGSSATLQWDVSNAEAVKIDPNVGIFNPKGSAAITPKTTTTYTLTAYNGIGIVIGSTQVLVQKDAAAGKTDLIISDIYKVTTPTGVKIGYTIENKGTQNAPASSSKLYANGEYKTSDAVGPIAAGAKFERQFDWNYNPSTGIISVIADADNNVADSDRGNNEMLVAMPVFVNYDFVANASAAQWKGSDPLQSIHFGTEQGSEGGAAYYRTDSLLEDGTGPGKYLETQPDLTYRGIITGDYEIGYAVKPGDHFYGLVGFLHGAESGNVRFQIYIRSKGERDWHEMGPELNALYDYRIDPMVIPIPPEYFGKKADFRLSVINAREPFQSWAVWIEAKVIR